MKKLLFLLIIPLLSLGQNKEFNDYYEAIDYAKKVNKPVLITFTGYACVNARKMEHNVLSTKIVDSLLKDVIICNLYVDDRINGRKWALLQKEKYGKLIQPYHVLYSWKDGVILEPIAYTPDYKKFSTWLEGGINDFYRTTPFQQLKKYLFK